MPSSYRSLALIAVVLVSVGAFSVFQPRAVATDASSVPVLPAVYAVPAERVETHVLSRGETLTNVLVRAAITGQEMADLLLGAREVLNPRRLADGAEITIRRWAADGSPRSIDVRVNADSTVRLQRRPFGWQGVVVETPVVVDTVYVAGSIERGRTLYEALVYDDESVLPPAERVQLVQALAEVYEFKLDFSREIQPGDSYRLVYTRERRPDGSARSRRILVSELVNQTVRYAAVWYDGGGEVRGYYDAEGKPLRSGFSRYPIKYVRITSRFNPSRYHPILGVHRAHLGTDFGAASGTPVYATADGTVSFAGVSGGYGNLIRITHANGYETRYAHLSRFAGGIRSGVRVRQGQEIGYVGATGLATAPHLHYELRRGGQAIDVVRARLPDAPPLAAEHLGRFLAIADTRVRLLEEATDRWLALNGPARSYILGEEEQD
jgi:murein DD-endopeptidase MepM/ murein hydrolase activator NlpD